MGVVTLRPATLEPDVLLPVARTVRLRRIARTAALTSLFRIEMRTLVLHFSVFSVRPLELSLPFSSAYALCTEKKGGVGGGAQADYG